MSLLDIYKSVEERLENDKPELFRLLDEHLDWDDIIPNTFYYAFYQKAGRRRTYEQESFLHTLFLQRIFHYVEDSQRLNTLRFNYEMRNYCGFQKVPDVSKITRFKQDFCRHIRDVFERLGDLTEQVCREMETRLRTCCCSTQPASRSMWLKITPSSRAPKQEKPLSSPARRLPTRR